MHSRQRSRPEAGGPRLRRRHRANQWAPRLTVGARRRLDHRRASVTPACPALVLRSVDADLGPTLLPEDATRERASR